MKQLRGPGLIVTSGGPFRKGVADAHDRKLRAVAYERTLNSACRAHPHSGASASVLRAALQVTRDTSADHHGQSCSDASPAGPLATCVRPPPTA